MKTSHAPAIATALFIGEVGCPPDWKGFPFIPESGRTEDLSKPDWARDMIGLIQKHKLHWTGFSFHPRTGPMVIQDWDYTPTPYWGYSSRKHWLARSMKCRRCDKSR